MAFLVIQLGCSSPSAPPPRVVAEVTAEPAPLTPEPPPEPGPAFDAVGDPASYLVDDFPEREPRRALMRRFGDLYWHIEAARGGYVDMRGKPDDQVWGAKVIVAERHRDHLRIVREASGLRATFYLAAEDFHELTARRATLLTSGGEPFAHGCGVSVPAGHLLDVRPPRVGYRRVVLRRPWIVAEGVLAERDVDIVYEADEARRDRVRLASPCKIRAPFTLRDAPDGRVVAELLDDELWFCTADEGARDGWRRIAFSAYDGVQLIGHVPASKVEERDPPELHDIGTIGRGAGAGWGASHTVFIYLSPGDFIFTPESHLPIAKVVEPDFQVGDEGASDGWHRVRFPFQAWGFEAFAITPETAARATERAEAKKHGAK